MAGELPSSKLGTIEHWNEVYEKELADFEDIGDEGEIWFGEHTLKKLVGWLENNKCVGKDFNVLDIGCGNGVTLVEMAKRGFVNLTGCDYSLQAVELARNIAEKETVKIDYMVIDILDLENSALKGRHFDVCIDKGTYDAISLNPKNSKHCRELYKKSLCQLLNTNGVFALASCNWTLDELKDFFKSDFDLIEELPSPKFTFGGVAGQSVTSCIWRKMS